MLMGLCVLLLCNQNLGRKQSLHPNTNALFRYNIKAAGILYRPHLAQDSMPSMA